MPTNCVLDRESRRGSLSRRTSRLVYMENGRKGSAEMEEGVAVVQPVVNQIPVVCEFVGGRPMAKIIPSHFGACADHGRGL